MKRYYHDAHLFDRGVITGYTSINPLHHCETGIARRERGHKECVRRAMSVKLEEYIRYIR
jgi:hypothetical protein